jgi:hypothetical protein
VSVRLYSCHKMYNRDRCTNSINVGWQGRRKVEKAVRSLMVYGNLYSFMLNLCITGLCLQGQFILLVYFKTQVGYNMWFKVYFCILLTNLKNRHGKIYSIHIDINITIYMSIPFRSTTNRKRKYTCFSELNSVIRTRKAYGIDGKTCHRLLH